MTHRALQAVHLPEAPHMGHKVCCTKRVRGDNTRALASTRI